MSLLVAINSGQFVADNLFHVILDDDIVLLHHFVHDIIAILICEVGDDGDWLVGFGFFGNLGIIDYDFGMEDFLVDTFVEVVRDGTDKHALCECGNLAGRNKTVHLRVDGG